MTHFLLPMELPRLDVALRDAAEGTAEARWVAALALGRERGSLRAEAIAALIALADDPVESVRVQGLEGLAEQARGGADIPEAPIFRAMAASSAEVRCAAIEAGVEILESPIQTIVGYTCDADTSVRATAARVLGTADARSEVDSLTKLLNDPCEPVRVGAALSLAQFGDLAATPVLVDVLKTKGDYAMEAAAALGEIGAKEAVQSMHRICAGWFVPKELKALIAAAMARCGDGRGADLLTEMLHSKRPRCRIAALSALTRLPVLSMAQALGRMIGQQRDAEASSAICALLSLGEIDAEAGAKELEKFEGMLSGELEQELKDARVLLSGRSHPT